MAQTKLTLLIVNRTVPKQKWHNIREGMRTVDSADSPWLMKRILLNELLQASPTPLFEGLNKKRHTTV